MRAALLPTRLDRLRDTSQLQVLSLATLATTLMQGALAFPGDHRDANEPLALADAPPGHSRTARRTVLHVRTPLTDALTGLPSRARLTLRLRALARRTVVRPDDMFAVLFVDLDNFGHVNDALGHTAGDQLLADVARKLSALMPGRDDTVENGPADEEFGPLVARFGGDAFVVLLDGLSALCEAVAVADWITATLARPISIGGVAITMRCSIGVTTGGGTSGSADVETLLRDADTALHYAKASGKGRHAVFTTAMQTSVRRRLTLEADLRKAVDNDQIEAVYQPIVSLASGRVESFEALARWNHPEWGPIPPAEFIPIAEDTGLITPLAARLLSRALDLLEALGRLPGGRTLRMNVNVSRGQLCDANFLAALRRLLSGTSIGPERLCLEITESVVASAPECVREALQAIKGLGVQLHMDDFGTGLSTLSLLRTLPIDGIKIDRSFIQTAAGDPQAIAILHAIIALGRNLRKTVTAEGIETDAQLATVLGLDCDLAQGWIFGHPVAPAQAAWIVGKDFSPSLLRQPR